MTGGLYFKFATPMGTTFYTPVPELTEDEKRQNISAYANIYGVGRAVWIDAFNRQVLLSNSIVQLDELGNEMPSSTVIGKVA